MKKHHVVIVGGGFAGLYAAQRLGKTAVKVTLIDKRNFHLFQPLLYQVATGGLSPGDISSPLRAVLNKYNTISVLQAEMADINPKENTIVLKDGLMAYDSLIIATGAHFNYFGNEHWTDAAPGLKTIEDALEIRRRILLAFEAAEREADPEKQQHLLNFVIIGGGATGVELAGALAELTYHTMRGDFRNINPAKSKIYLIEGAEKLLGTYPDSLSKRAKKKLEKLGVTVLTNTFVAEIKKAGVQIKSENNTTLLQARTVLWAAGVKAAPIAKIVAAKTGAETDKSGRIIVQPDCTIAGFSNIFVVGDLAHFAHQTGKPLPGVAPVAMQQGRYVAVVIKKRLEGKQVKPFRYRNKGDLAVIGRNAAVAQIGFLRFSGWLAWIIWIFVHIGYLIEFDNKILVLFQWAWNYFTRNRGARLITAKQNDYQ